MAKKKAAKKVAKPAAKTAAKAASKRAPKPPVKTAKSKPQKSAAPSPPPSAEREQAQLYATAVEAFQAGKLKQALNQFERVAEGPDTGLRHRAQVHIRICRQRTESDTLKLSSADDHYNYAVKLINDRRLEEAEKHLDQALKKAAGAGYIHYAKAVVAALRKDGADAFSSLSRAIDLDPKHRLLARRDPDLAGIRDDARIADLLQGESTGAD